MEKRHSSVPSTLLPILPSRHVRFCNGSRAIINPTESGFRSLRNGTGTGTMQTTPRHRSFKRLANRIPKAGTLTVLEGVENIVPTRPPAGDPPSPGSATQKTAITQNKRSGPTSRMTTRRKPSRQSRRNPSYTSNTTMRSQEGFRGSQTQNSLLARMPCPPIQCLCHTNLERAPSPSYAINSLAICSTPAMKPRPSTSFRQVNLL